MSVHSPAGVPHIEEEALDPRVQVELENLNAATNEINLLESALEEANNTFRASLNETSVQLQALSKKLGVCVEKARPYYETKEKAKKLQLDCQRAAVQYQRANAVHHAARETIALAEERFINLKQNSKERKFDSAWQEMLNHATMKVMEAEAQKSASEREHRKRAASYTATEKEVQELHNKLKSSINKSRPYFNHRAATQIKLEAQKERIYKLQKDVLMAKNKYSFTLRHLEQISEEIHELRRINMKREPGVGAEMSQCEPFIEKAPSDECLFNAKVDEEQEYWNTLRRKIRDLKDDKNSDETKKDDSIFVYKDSLSLPYEGSQRSPESLSISSSLKTKSQGPTVEPKNDSWVSRSEGTINSIESIDKNDLHRAEGQEFDDKEMAEVFHEKKRPCDTLSLTDIIIIEKEFEKDMKTEEPEKNQRMREKEGKDELLSVPKDSLNSKIVQNAVKNFEKLAVTCAKLEVEEDLHNNINVIL